MKKYLLSTCVGFTTLCGIATLVLSVEAQAMELAVPYVSQAPDGNWVAPWDEACEEASITMINGFYDRTKTIPKETSKQQMQQMIDWEKLTFKKYEDTSAEETVRLIQQFGSFTASIKRSPSPEEIKRELDAQRPVIAFVDMYKFYNERPAGDGFHVFVIVGYDEQKKEFIVNDPGREPRRYSYERLLGALHDYNPASKEADNEATVLFTARKPSDLKQAFLNVIAFFKGLLA